MADLNIQVPNGGADLSIEVAKGQDITLEVAKGNEITLTVDKGNAGASGFSGQSGYSGYSGFSGMSGASTSGYSGFSGLSGYSGYSGASGLSGYSGSGVSGYSGSGISGYSGYSGFSGQSGASTSGYSGFSGISGFSGFSGYSGSGASGYSGYSGINGLSGYSGQNGQSGISGYSGYSGFSGAVGTSGFSGYSGSGVSGYSGYSGYSGFSGAQGSSSSLFLYQAQTTATSGQPTNGHLLWNNATQISATQININHLTDDNTDIDVFLALLVPTETFILQDRNVSSNYQSWRITGTTTNINPNTANSYWTVPVSLISSGGTGTTNFANNHQLFFALTKGVSGASGYSGYSGFSGQQGTSGFSGYSGYSGTSGYSGIQAPIGGTNTQIQYNNAGVLGGVPQLTYNGTTLAITGGTINNTVIGGATPAVGTFTIITGQTEVLKGTGNNLVLQSQTFNTTWNNQNLTITTGATTAPDSTTTGNNLVPTTSSAIHRIQQSFTWVSGLAYTVSVYAKANGYRYLYLNLNNPLAANNTFDLQTGTVVTASGGTATITSAGNGWYRCVVTATPASTNTNNFNIQVNNTTSASDNTFVGDGTSGIYLWGAQVEIGSVANTYIPTTTTAVYGTPTLSFSGVAGLGLQSDGSLYVSPAGTGALQAQATTSSTVGGNARGANAVDWQTSRDTAARVASGSTSFIGSGRNNTASGQDSFVGGGFTNTASSSQAAVVSGARNSASNPSTFIGGGNDNTAGFTYATVVGGQTNTASGYFGFVGNGLSNSTTSSSAVTTQGTTSVTSGSTSVTLSGSNANIKVGQLITGTGINFPDTYVAAISGTALTLSRTATGTGTPTLSFYTPHGVVVGGGNNQATGSYSFIGGGGDAGTAANRNVASGDWSFVGGGRNNTASGGGAFVGGGGVYPAINNTYPNTASGVASVVVGGLRNSATGEASFVGGGIDNLANSRYSTITGGTLGTTRSITGNTIFPAHESPVASASGVSQSALLILGKQTTDATPTVLCSNGSAAGTTNQVILPNNSAYYFKVSVISNVTGGGNTKAWTLEGAIKRGAGVGTTAIVGSVTTTVVAADAGALTWTVTATADTTNGGLAITFTGQAATTIRTVARVQTTEMTY